MAIVKIEIESRDNVLTRQEHLLVDLEGRVSEARHRVRTYMIEPEINVDALVMSLDQQNKSEIDLIYARSSRIRGSRVLVLGKVVRIPLPSKKYH